MEKLLISACLVGENCKYNGLNNLLPPDILGPLREKYELIPVCPEMLGGLQSPREPCERLQDRVITPSGKDCTKEFFRGAELVAQIAAKEKCCIAVLKERSPSCGAGEIYDGGFSHRVIPGDGVCAQVLRNCGVRILGESRVRELIEEKEF